MSMKKRMIALGGLTALTAVSIFLTQNQAHHNVVLTTNEPSTVQAAETSQTSPNVANTAISEPVQTPESQNVANPAANHPESPQVSPAVTEVTAPISPQNEPGIAPPTFVKNVMVYRPYAADPTREDGFCQVFYSDGSMVEHWVGRRPVPQPKGVTVLLEC